MKDQQPVDAPPPSHLALSESELDHHQDDDDDDDLSQASLTSKCSSTKKIDSFLAKELYNMKVDDRNRIQEELHGVQSALESPLMVENAVAALRDQVDRRIQAWMKTATAADESSKWGFCQAMMLPNNQLYIKSHPVCLQYLRADRWNAEAASTRLVNHLKLLYKYFGNCALQRPLRLNDLNKQEQDLLKAGHHQVLLSRDRAGRLIFFSYGSMSTEGLTDASRLRILLYLFCCLSEDEETQKKGYVSIAVPDRSVFETFNGISDAEMRQDWKDYLNNSYKPVRLSAFHLVHPEGPAFQLLKAFWVAYMSRKEDCGKARFYTDLGLETQYQLLTYGIPIQELPLTVTGTLKTKNHLLWMKSRKIIDKARATGQEMSKMGTFHPGVNDVLFSRGGNASHFGNLEFQQMILSRIDAYNEGGRKERTAIRNEMIQLVHEKGCRFLTLQTDGWWMELANEKLLMEKVTTAVYDCNRKAMAKGRRQEARSETTQFLDGNKRQRMGTSKSKGGAGPSRRVCF